MFSKDALIIVHNLPEDMDIVSSIMLSMKCIWKISLERKYAHGLQTLLVVLPLSYTLGATCRNLNELIWLCSCKQLESCGTDSRKVLTEELALEIIISCIIYVTKTKLENIIDLRRRTMLTSKNQMRLTGDLAQIPSLSNCICKEEYFNCT